MDQIIVRKIDMPLVAQGVTALDKNGDYNIYLNTRYSYETQLVAFRHEIEHIKQGHFYSCEDLKVLEDRANEVV